MVLAALLYGRCLVGQALSPEERSAVAAAISAELQTGEAPAISVAIARGDSIVYQQALGWAVQPSDAQWPLRGQAGRLSGRARLVEPEMAFPIGSNTKAFTAACVLLLQQEGKLQLDDPIARWLPAVTEASTITVRELLTHTSGLPDDAPEPYLTATVSRATSASEIASRFGTRPLDFPPGSRYEYSNTNYVLASLIVERASGMPFHDFLWSRVIQPLHLAGVLDLDEPGQRGRLRVVGHEHYALGPLRPDALEAPGWYAGAGELAMPAAALAAWDLSLLNRTLLSTRSYDAMEAAGTLHDGTGTNYGLALHTGVLPNGKAVLYHGGVVEGFVSANLLVPADRLAIVVLTNSAADAAPRLRSALERIFEPVPAGVTSAAANQGSTIASPVADAPVFEAQVSRMIADLQAGRLRRRALTHDLNFYFSAAVRGDFRRSLAPLGPVSSVALVEQESDAGMVFRVFHVHCRGAVLRVSTYTTRRGKLQQFLVTSIPQD